MNCQGNQLARIVAPAPDNVRDMIVFITDVHPIATALSGVTCWELKGKLVARCGCCAFIAMPDSMLRPLANPPDDAVDEMVQRLGSPNELAEVARHAMDLDEVPQQ